MGLGWLVNAYSSHSIQLMEGEGLLPFYSQSHGGRPTKDRGS